MIKKNNLIIRVPFKYLRYSSFIFSKIFHPDPSVERQSGLLKPTLNNSNLLGSSLTLPYFKVISENKDFTFAPTWFDNKI